MKDKDSEERYKYVTDDSWAGDAFIEHTKPSKNASAKYTKTVPPIDSSFILALKYKRYRLLDHIFSKFMSNCVGELTSVKADADLNIKWCSYVGIDSYLPLLLVWITV